MNAEERTVKEAVQEKHSTIEFLMRRMRHQGDLPAFSEHIVEINSTLSSLTAITFSSAGDLAKIILKDYSLTNKLLKVVNSALYVTLSGKVATVSKAVLLLGFEKIRMIAATLLIFEHLQNRAQATELKELAIGACMSGLIAMDVADNMKLGNREEVFICAMLHNLGKMLAVCYLPEEHGEIRKRMALKDLDEAAASQSVLGVTYTDLGMAVSRSWNFPDKIVRSMETPPAGIIAPPRTEHELLRNMASYSNDLFGCFMNTLDDDRASALSEMSVRYQPSVPLTVEQIESVIASSMSKIDHYSDVIRMDKKNSDFLRELMERRQTQLQQSKRRKSTGTADEASGVQPSARGAVPVQCLPSKPADVLGTAAAAGDSEGFREGTETGKCKIEAGAEFRTDRIPPSESISPPADRAETPQADVLQEGLREIAEAMKGSFILGDVMYMILETMYRGFRFHRVIFCLGNAEKSRMAARFGLGENADDIVKRFQFLTGQGSDIFNAGIAQEKGIVIHDAAAPGIAKGIPEWYRQIVGAPSFLIYPLRIKGSCIGMFYADRREKGRLVTEEDLESLEKLRNLAIEAIVKQRF